MDFLKASTAVTVKIGPFLDNEDGDTAKTGLTIAQADVQLSKNGGAMAQKGNSTACTHDKLGYYNCALSTTDTGTIGMLKLAVHVSGALAVWHTFTVLHANVYDSLFGDSALVTVADVAPVEDVAEAMRDVDNSDPAEGSLGAAVNTASSAGDPWATTSLGSYGAGTAGKLVSDNLDAKVSTRSTFDAASDTVKLAANQDVRNVSGTLPNVTLASTQGSYAPAKAGDKMDLVDAPNSTALVAIRTTMQAAGQTLATLLSRIVGTLASGTHNAQSGDAYAVVNNATYGNAKLVRSATPGNALAVDGSGKVAVPDTQKVDLDTIKGKTVTCGANVTVRADVGTATQSTAQTGDAYAKVNNGTYGNEALKTAIGGLNNLSSGDVGTAVGTALGTYNAAKASDLPGEAPTVNEIKNGLQDTGTHLAAIKDVADKLDTMLEEDDSDYRYTTEALVNAPAGGGGGGGEADWTEGEREQMRSVIGIDGGKAPATGGTIQSIAAAVAALKGMTALGVVSPVAQDGKYVELVRGADYSAADARQLSWTWDQWPDLAGATVTLNIHRASGALAIACTVGGTYPEQTVTAEPTADETAQLDPGMNEFQVWAETAGAEHKIPLVCGVVNVRVKVGG